MGNFILTNWQPTFAHRNATFAEKTRLLTDAISHRLTMNLQAFMSENGPVDLEGAVSPLELTLAGYDLDKSLKIARITLKAERTDSGVIFASVLRETVLQQGLKIPTCTLTASSVSLDRTPWDGNRDEPRIITVGKSMFCEVAGLSATADSILSTSPATPVPAWLDEYWRAKSSGNLLTVEQMRALAHGLVKATEDDERRNGQRRVGGNVQEAVLENDKVTLLFGISDVEPGNEEIGSRLSLGRGTQVHTHCNGGMGVGGHGVISGEITNCHQPLDGLIFHDTTFIDSQLMYFGKDMLDFDQNNKIINSSLQLDEQANMESPAVIKLVCNFRWLAVQHGSSNVDVGGYCTTHAKPANP